MTTATTRPVIAYAMPIGGGWAHFCAACFDEHRNDTESDPDAVAECEPIVEFSSGVVPCCEICNRVCVESAGFVDVETAIKRLTESTIGRVETANEEAILHALLKIHGELNG